MALHQMFDAAFPPSQPYPGCEAVAGYIGGNTPHTWTPAEWQRFAHLRQIPIWTGYQEADPAQHGRQAADAMHALGWRPKAHPFRAVVLDMEDEMDGAWVAAFAAQILDAGYVTVPYVSLAAVKGTPPRTGYWVPDWNGAENVVGAHVVGHQYAGNVAWDSTQVDLSVIDDDFLAHGGIGARRG